MLYYIEHVKIFYINIAYIWTINKRIPFSSLKFVTISSTCMDALIISILHTYKWSLLSLKAKLLWWGPSFFMQISYCYYFFLVLCIAWIHLFSILHLRISWALHSIAENSLLCIVSRQAKYYECAFNFFLLPFHSCLCDTNHRLCLFCNILPNLKYKKIRHAMMHPKLKELVADKVWRQQFHQRENFINKHKNSLSFNNITDLWNTQTMLFILVSIFTYVLL